MADCNYDLDIECNLQNSSTIQQLKAKDQQLQSQVNNINNEINKNVPGGGVEGKGIKQRLDDVEACCEDKQDQIDQVNAVVSEIGDNITLLKGMSTRQDEKINSLKQKVIKDETYFNFEDWVENVYIPQCDSITNKYSEGDIYINVNQDVASTNATYVCVKKDPSAPCSANDWQEIYYSAPADVMTILGIDPIKVTHPYKHEWVVSVDPRRLADMIGGLQTLDLSKVEVTLGEVYFEPVIKESVTIQENLNVGNTTTTKELDAEIAYIDRACIREMICDTNYIGTQNFENIVVNNLTANNYTQEGGTFNIKNTHVKIEGDHVEIPNIEGDTHFHDHIYAPDINITNKTETTQLHVHHDTHLEGHISIEGDFKLVDQRPSQQGRIICMDNVMMNLFKPSFGIFDLKGSGISDAVAHTVVFGIGSDAIGLYNDAWNREHPDPAMYVTQIPHGGPKNNTTLSRDKTAFTGGVYLETYGDYGSIITIDGTGDDAGVYQINFNMTIGIDDTNSGYKNIFAHRAGVVLFDPLNPTTDYTLVDDKDGVDYFRAKFSHTHTHGVSYFDANDGDYSSGSRTRTTTTDPTTISFVEPYAQRCGEQGGPRSDVDYTVGDYATFTRSILVPIKGKKMCIAPYYKPASGCVMEGVRVAFTITENSRQTGSKAQIYINKISNITDSGSPYEYYC